jgi:hypothetical protein
MPLLFAYGTLQQEAVQLSTFGRLLAGQPDEVIGFELTLVRIEDPQVVAVSGETHYGNAAFNGRADSRVRGMAFELTEAELSAADGYERRAGYERVAVELASGHRHETRGRPERVFGVGVPARGVDPADSGARSLFPGWRHAFQMPARKNPPRALMVPSATASPKNASAVGEAGAVPQSRRERPFPEMASETHAPAREKGFLA